MGKYNNGPSVYLVCSQPLYMKRKKEIEIVAKALDGQRYPLPLFEYMWVCDGERGRDPEGDDDLCLVSFEALGLNFTIFTIEIFTYVLTDISGYISPIFKKLVAIYKPFKFASGLRKPHISNSMHSKVIQL